MIQCFNKHSTVEANLVVVVYIHVFLTKALHRDVPLTSTSDSYVPASRNTGTYSILGMVLDWGWRDWTGEWYPYIMSFIEFTVNSFIYLFFTVRESEQNE